MCKQKDKVLGGDMTQYLNCKQGGAGEGEEAGGGYIIDVPVVELNPTLKENGCSGMEEVLR